MLPTGSITPTSDIWPSVYNYTRCPEVVVLPDGSTTPTSGHLAICVQLHTPWSKVGQLLGAIITPTLDLWTSTAMYTVHFCELPPSGAAKRQPQRRAKARPGRAKRACVKPRIGYLTRKAPSQTTQHMEQEHITITVVASAIVAILGALRYSRCSEISIKRQCLADPSAVVPPRAPASDPASA